MVVGVLMAAAVAVALPGCSDDPDKSDESSSDGSDAAEGGPDSSETSAPPTTLYAAVGDLGLTPEQTECLRGALPEGTDPDQVPTEALDQARAACAQQDAAQAWVAGLAESGAYRPEQLECLRNAYAALSPEDVQKLVEAAVNPQSPPADASQVLEGLYVACGASLPG